MAEIGRWNGVRFEVKSSYILGFTNLTIKGSMKTEDKESGGVQYAANKAKNPTEISLTAHLDARTGCDVRTIAMQLVEMAGAEDYFYIASKKLVPYKMRLVTANATNITMNNAGTWICCDVELSMKRSSTEGASAASTSGGSSSGSSQKASLKKEATTTAKKAATTAATSGVLGAAVANAAKNVKTAADAVAKAQNKVNTLTAAAKKTSQQAKKTTTVGGGGGKKAIAVVALK